MQASVQAAHAKAALRAGIGRGLDTAKSASEAAKGAALEAREAMQASVAEARAAVESGASLASLKLGLPSMAKLGLVGWGDANARAACN